MLKKCRKTSFFSIKLKPQFPLEKIRFFKTNNNHRFLNDESLNFILRAKNYLLKKKDSDVDKFEMDDEIERKNRLVEEGKMDWDPYKQDKEIIKKMIKCVIEEKKEFPKEVESILKSLGLKSNRRQLYNLLIRLGVFRKDENYNIFSHRGLLQAPDNVKNLAESIYQNHSRVYDYVRVSDRSTFDQSIFSIDGPDAKEIDDAVSISKKGDQVEWVFVHIADPTHHLNVGDHLESFARNRGSSIYLPEACYPMFPNIFSKDLCSIKKSVENLALTFALKIDNQDQPRIKELKLVPSILKNVSCLIYEDVERFLVNGETSQFKDSLVEGAQLENITLIEEISNHFRHHRKTQMLESLDEDRLNLIYHNIKISLNKDGAPIFNVEKETRSNKLIEEMMISAGLFFFFINKKIGLKLQILGSSAANYAFQNQIPIIYRTQTPAKDAPTTRFERIEFEYPKELDEKERIALEMMNAFSLKNRFSFFSSKPSPHGDLNLNTYCYVTSPLRRYADIANHFQLKAHLNKQNLPFNSTQLEYLSGNLFKSYQENSLLEKRSFKYWALRYMEKDNSRIYSAILLKKKYFKIFDRKSDSFDYSSNTFKKGHVHTLLILDLKYLYEWYSPVDIGLGQLINVRCSSVDVLNGQANFELIEKK